MTRDLRILSVVGARPQFIKVAAFHRACEQNNATCPGSRIQHQLVHTGQHYDWAMSDAFFDELDLPNPDVHLGVGSASHGMQTGKMLTSLEPTLVSLQPEVVVVYGDTNSTLAGALAAAKLHLPVAHVEAGLRSFCREMPEEINRVVTDHVSTILFCPSKSAVENLGAEGIVEGVHLVGDLMYDALRASLPSEVEQRSLIEVMGLVERGYALATLHRAANTDDLGRLGRMMEALDLICAASLPVILPMHPRTRERLGRTGRTALVQVIEPLGHRQMLALAANARVILTDSGGLQKEALWLRVPCVTLRDETEWPETVEMGWNTLVSDDPTRIVEAALRPADSPRREPVYGSGGAAEQMLEILFDLAALGQYPEVSVG
jgi:UDP-GlcNAc3NAcA epimerase